MLQKVMPHGFEFWEAPRNTGPVFEDVEREERERQNQPWEEMTGNLVQFVEENETQKYGKRKEDPNDPEIWGDLVQFSDEEPVTILEALGIPRDEETLARRGGSEPDLAEIQEKVIQAFGVAREEFFGRRDCGEADLARLASMALCRAFTNRTTEEIGDAHRRNRTAACYAVKRVAILRAMNLELERKLASIESELMPMQAAA